MDPNKVDPEFLEMLREFGEMDPNEEEKEEIIAKELGHDEF